MPAGDRTGPLGLGPMTGRAAGYCAGYPVPGFMNPIPGRGMGRGFGWGRGRGRGRGWGHGFYGVPGPAWWPAYGAAPVSPPSDEMEMLKAQAQHMEKALTEIRNRIDELETASTKEA
jgi:hypothetical protein